MSSSSSVAEAERLKAEGNDAYRAGDYARAIARYTRAFAYIGLKPISAESAAMLAVSGRQNASVTDNAVSALHVSLNVNLAACYVALSDWPRVVDYSARAIALDADNAKAHFRRGTAFLNIGDLDNADADLQKALALNGGSDGSISRALSQLSVKRRLADEKQRTAFAGMFDKLH